MIYFLIYRNLLELSHSYNLIFINYLKDLRDFGFCTDCLVLYVTWRPFVFLNQFDLNLFMITAENASIFRLLTKESMLLTSATFLIEKRS
jgi:hypothetical protein